MAVKISQFANMELMLQSLEEANKSLEDANRYLTPNPSVRISKKPPNREYRKKAKELETARAASPARRTSVSSARSLGGTPNTQISLAHITALNKSREQLLALETEYEGVKLKNIELEEKVEELEAMLEVLRMQSTVRGRHRQVAQG